MPPRDHETAPALATYEIDWKNPKPAELIDFTTQQYAAGKQRRQAWEREAAERLAWVRGDQNQLWNAESRDLVAQVMRYPGSLSEEEKTLAERFPVQINMLKRFVMSWIGLVFGKPVGWHVFPRTSEPDDENSAKVSTELLNYYWASGIEHGMVRLFDAMWHAYATSIIWVKPIWDPQRHFAEHFSEATDQPDLPNGDLVFDFATGFGLTEPEGCRMVSEAAWIIDSRLRSIEWGLEHYGEKFKDVRPDARTKEYGLQTYEMSGFSYDKGSSVQGRQAPDERVLVHELWRPKSRTVPNGFLCVVADRQLITSGDHPYLHGRLPFIPLQEQPDFEHFRPGCGVRDLMGLQHARNHTRSLRQGHLQTTVNPIIVKEKQVVVDDDAFTHDGPHMVDVTLNALTENKIKPWYPPPLQPDAVRLDEQLRTDMEDVAGIHGNTMGAAESKSQSGKHAALMTQGDMRTNVVSKGILEKALAKVGQQGLWLLFQFVKKERMVPIVGPERISEVLSFTGGDLSKDGRPYGPYEFNIQATIAVEPDMGAVLAKIDLLLERGVLNPQNPNDRQLIAKWLGEEWPGASDVGETHRNNAKAENSKLLKGIVLPSMGDDDALHVYEHDLFRTSGEFRGQANAELEKNFDVHTQAHWRNAARKALEPKMIAMEVQEELMQQYPNARARMMRQAAQQQNAGGTASGGGASQTRKPTQAGRLRS